MSRTIRLVPLALVVALVAACSKRQPDPSPVAPTPVPEDDGSIPAPREVPPAAEPSDAKDAMEVSIVSSAKGVWKAQYPQGQRVLLGGKREGMTTTERISVSSLVLPIGRPVTLAISSETGAGQFEIAAFPLTVVLDEGGPKRATMKPIRTGEFGIWSGRERVGTVVVVTNAEFDAWLQGKQFGLPRALITTLGD